MPDPREPNETEALRELMLRLPELSGREWAIEPLGGGMTNRNYLIRGGGDSFVVRVAGEGTGLLGIDRDQEAACARAAAEAGIGPDVIATLADPAVLVTRFVPGRVLTAEALREPSTLRGIARSIRRYHDGPVPPASDFCPFESVRRNHALATERDAPMPAEMGRALETLGRIEEEARTDEPPALCHNDLLPANLIEDDDRVWIIDWEFAGRGDRFFDLATLAANGEFDPAQEETLLDAYSGEVRPRELRRLRLMRRTSDLRESTWGYLQSVLSGLHDPAFYVDYGRRHLARFLAGD